MPWSPDSIYEQCEREYERQLEESSEEGEETKTEDTEKIIMTKCELIELLHRHDDDTKIEFKICVGDQSYELESPMCETPQGKRTAAISFKSDDIEKLKLEADELEAKINKVNVVLIDRVDTLSVDDLAGEIQDAIL